MTQISYFAGSDGRCARRSLHLSLAEREASRQSRHCRVHAALGINVDRACHCTVGPEESGAGLWVTARPVPRAVVDWWWWWVDGLLGRWGEGLGSRGGSSLTRPRPAGALDWRAGGRVGTARDRRLSALIAAASTTPALLRSDPVNPVNEKKYHIEYFDICMEY